MTAVSSPAPRKPGLLLPTLLTVVGTVVLCTLGTWQLQRMGEKHAYLDRLQEQAAGTPASMPAFLCNTPAQTELQQITTGRHAVFHFIAGAADLQH